MNSIFHIQQSRSRLFAFAVTLAYFFPLSLAASPTGDVLINIDNIEKKKGIFLVNLYNGEKGFPGDPDHAIKKLVIKYDAAKPQATFKSITYGAYSIAVCHDANANNKCDVNFLGIPQEGVGISNNAKGFMGPPKYKDAEFTLNTGTRTLNITLDY